MAVERKAPALTVVVDDDMTHCSICTEIFDNPWSLPCLHTFCLKCLDSLRTHSHPKGNLKCPICKRECEISAEGIAGITHNFFIQRLVDSIEQPGPSNAYCSEHENRLLEMYCFDCKRNVCMKCCTINHREHNYKDVDDAANTFRDQIDADIAAVQSRIDATTRHQQQQKEEVDSFLDSLNPVESAVNKRYNELKTLIDNEKKRLLQQIESTKKRAVKQFKETEERENLSLVAMKSFIIYAQEMKSKEQSRDVTRDGNGIHDRASELLMTYPMGEVDNRPRLVFKPAYNNAERKDPLKSNLMGQLSEITNSQGAVIECLTDVPSWKVKVLPADVCEKAVVRVSNEWHKEIAAHRVKLNPLLWRGVDVKETPQELTLEGNWESVCEALEMIELQLVVKWKESSAKMEKDAQLSGIKSITDPTARDCNDDDNASHQKRADDSSGVAASNVMAGHSVTHTVTGRQNPVDTAVKINQVREIDECVWTYIKAKFADMASYFETKLSPVGIDRTGKIQLSGQLQELNLFDEFYQQHRLELVVEITVKLPMYWGKAAAKDMAGELDVVTYDVSSTNDNSFKGIGRKDDLANFMKFLNDSVPSGDVSQGSNQLPTAKGVAQSMAGGNSSARSSPPAARLVRHTGDSLMLETPSARLTVSIMKGDLTKQRVEVIVNPANSLLQHHGGAAKAIADAAGYEMRWACEDYIKKHHKLPVSEVMDTTAGYLYPSIKRIIHVCGPKYKNYQDDTECKKHLERTFHNCLVHANDNLFAKSMAIPAISAGTFGCPWDMVTTAAYNALMSFDSYMASLLPRQRHLASIYFVNIDREITLAFVDMFSELIKSDVNASSVPSYEANDNNGSIPVVGQRLPNVDGTGKDPAKCCVCGRVKSLTKKDCGHKACVSCRFKSCLKCAQSRAVPGGSKRTPADDTTTVTARPKSSLDVGKSGTANGSAVKGDGSSFNRKRSGSFSGAIGRSVAGSKATTKSAANGDSPDVDSSKDDDNFDLSDSTPSPLRRTNSLTLHDRKKPADGAASGGSTSGEMCAICMDEIKNSKKLECGHKFCTDCINVALKHSSKCPCCGQIVGKLVGNQPDGGTMKWRTSLQDLPGFRGAGSIEITYDIPSGFQQDNHPNPGRPFRGTQRVAYLPNNSEGNEILKLLREAFKARLVFTVGRSATTGEENVVVWNDIHHKTSRTGQYGYPDYTYLTRVKMELAAKGIGVKGASPAAAVPPVSVDDPAGATGRPLPPRTAWTNPTSGSDTTPRSSVTSRSNSGSPHSPSLSKRSTAAAAVTTCYSSSRPTSSATKTSSVKGTTASTTSAASSLAGGSLSSAGFATSYPLTSTRLSSATDLTRRDDFTSPLTSSLTRYPEDRYDYRTSGSSSSQSYLSLQNHSHDDHKNAVNVRVERHHTSSGSRGSSHLGDKGSDNDLRRHVHSSRSSAKPTSSSSAGGSVYGGVMSSVSSWSTQSPTAGYGSAYLGSSSSYSDGRSSRPFTTGVGYDSSVSRGGVYDTHGRLDFRGSSR